MPRPIPGSLALRIAVALLATPVFGAAARAQPTYTLDASGKWIPAAPAPVSAGEATINRARALLAEGRAGQAEGLLDDWIEAHQTSDHPLLPAAYLLRGDAVLAGGNEYLALYDYEEVCRSYPASPEFLTALERELEIAVAYLGGMRRKWLGMRVTPAHDVGEELLIRVQERLPGSRLAERAALALGRYYLPEAGGRRLFDYRVSAFGQTLHKPPTAFDYKAAEWVYEAFLKNFPRSEHITYARKRRIEAIMARYRGPNYDASSLLEARVLIEDFQETDPAGARLSGFDDTLLARFDEAAATQLLEKARWYLRRRDPVSARFTLRRIIQLHASTGAAAAALEMLDERGWTPVPPPPPAAPPAPAEATPPAEGAPPAPPPKGEVPASSPAEGATPSTPPTNPPAPQANGAHPTPTPAPKDPPERRP